MVDITWPVTNSNCSPSSIIGLISKAFPTMNCESSKRAIGSSGNSKNNGLVTVADGVLVTGLLAL